MSRNIIKQTPFITILLALAILLVGGTGSAIAEQQIVSLVPASGNQAVGSTFSLTATYNVDTGDNTLTGLGVRFHFDSSKMTFSGFSNDFATGQIAKQGPLDDSASNFDGDASTDQYVLIAWADPFSGNWPNQTLPLALTDLGFEVVNDPQAAGATTVNVTFSSTASGYTGVGNSATVTITVPDTTVSGQVSYGGSAGGTYYVAAFTATGGEGWDANPVKMVSSANGSYSLGLQPGDYYIGAFRDANDGAAPVVGEPDPFEPVGFYSTTVGPTGQNGLPSAVTVVVGNPQTINFTIYDRPYFITDSSDISRHTFPDSGYPAGIPTGYAVYASIQAGYRQGTNLATVTFSGNDFSGTLHDDGLFPDDVAGDSIFSGWAEYDGTTVPPAGTYDFTITANDLVQSESVDFSSPAGAVLEDFATTAPGAYATSLTPDFGWEDVSVVDYGVVVFDTASPTSPGDIIYEGDSATNSHTMSGFSLTEGQQYWWFAQAFDATEENSSFSTFSTFTVDTLVPAGPGINPLTGTYNISQTVTITPAGGVIATYYTTDGTNPSDVNGTAYTAPFAVDGVDGTVVTVKAISYDAADLVSSVTTVVYTFDKVGPIAPTFDIGTGTYNAAQAVTPTLAGDAAATYYTTNGDDPDSGDTQYTSGTIAVDGADSTVVTLKMVSYDAVGNIGTIGSAVYTFDKQGPAAPTFDIGTGTYNAAQNVTPTVAGDAAETYYTLDGSDPNSGDTPYTSGTIAIDGANGAVITLKMISYDAVGNGTIGSAVYTFDKVGPVAATFDIGTDCYSDQQDVTPTLANDANTTYYTLDGNDPDSGDTPYTTGTIAVDGADGDVVTLKMVSYDAVGNLGAIAAATYTFDKVVPVTSPSIAAGTYGTTQLVSLSVIDDNLETTYANLLTSDPGQGYTPTSVYTPGTLFSLTQGTPGSITNYWLAYYSVDCAGSAETVHVDAYVINTNVPVTNVSYDPLANEYSGARYSGTAITVTLSSSPGIIIHYEVVGGNSGTFDTTGDLPFAAEGSYTINFYAENTVTQLSEQPRTLNLVLDFTEPADPTINVTSPTNVAVQTIGGSKEAHSAIYLQGQVDPIVPIDGSTTWSYSYALNEGDNNIVVYAQDAAGNTSGTASATIVLDRVVPFTSGHDPAKGATGQPLNKPIVLHVQDAGVGVNNATIQMSVNGTPVAPVIDGTTADYTLTYTPAANYPPLSSVTVVVNANDLAGNALVTDSYSFTTGATVSIAPTSIGLAEGDSYTFTASGGSLPYVWTRSPEANSSITPAGDGLTAVFTASADGTYTVTVTDDTSATANATVNVYNPIVIGSLPAGSAMLSASANTFTATGGTGTYVWSASAGTINPSSGAFTAPTVATGSVSVTITATDATYANISASETIDVYATVTVTNDPGDGYMVYAGDTSDDFTVAGGDGTYTWSATGPDGGDASDALSATDQDTTSFTAPTTGDFAGEYIINVEDGNGFSTSFSVWVPIKLVARLDGETNTTTFFNIGATIEVEATGLPSDANLVIAYSENPAGVVDGVGGDKPATTTGDNTFQLDAIEAGNVVITVSEDTDANMYYSDVIRLDIIGAATVSGSIGNIDANLVPDPSADISVKLRNLMTWAVVHATGAGGNAAVGADGAYSLANVAFGSYWVELKVTDATVPAAYLPYTTGALLEVGAMAVSKNFTLPALTEVINSYTLTINMGGAYAAPDSYSYSIKKASDLSEVASGTNTTATVDVNLEEGTYRLSILAAGYEPYEYNVAGDYDIVLDQSLPVTASLVAAVGFDPDPPVVEASHEMTDTGFDLSIVTENFAGAFTMAINGVGAVAPSGGSGVSSDPFTYTWNTGIGPAGSIDTPAAGDTTYTVTFTFSDGGTALDYTYTATYVAYASAANANADKPEDQNELEDEYQDQATFINLGEKEFLPIEGGIVNIKLRDHLGGIRSVALNIPPIPLSYLKIDDDLNGLTVGDNLLYNDNAVDRYDIPAASPLGTEIAPADILKVKVKYYTFGPRTLANGASLSFVVSRGPHAGAMVRYNPIPSGSVARDPNAPKITLPLLLNPQSPVFSTFQRLSQAKGVLRVLVSERGDGRPFPGLAVESLPFTVQDDGLMLVQVHHLTTVAVQQAAVTPPPSSGGGGGSGGCFIATAAYGSYFEDHVMILRQLRDDILLHSGLGRAFVAAYYKTSPPIADFIADHDALRAMVRWGLAPVVGLSWVALNHGALAALAMLFMVLALVSGSGVMLYRRRKQ